MCIWGEHPPIYMYRIDRDCTVENGACTGTVRLCSSRKWQKGYTRERVGWNEPMREMGLCVDAYTGCAVSSVRV